MAITDQEILDKAREAELRILGGNTASYSVAGNSFSYHNIAQLQKLIEGLQVRIARDSGERPTVLLGDLSGRRS